MWRDEVNYVMKGLRFSTGIVHIRIIVRIDDDVKKYLARILHACADLAGIRDNCAVAGRDSSDRAGAGSFDAVFGL